MVVQFGGGNLGRLFAAGVVAANVFPQGMFGAIFVLSEVFGAYCFVCL